MGRLSDQEIKNLLLSRGYTAIDLSSYRNKDSKILVKCKEGHIFSSSLKELERPSFQCPNCVGEKFNKQALLGQIPDKGENFRIIAFDQSSENIGVSIYDNGVLTYYDWYKISGKLDTRLAKWFTFLNNKVIPEWKPDYLVFEDIQYQKDSGVVTFKTLAEVLGIACMTAELNNIPHTKILNKTWQAEFSIAGSNRVAQKKNVVERVRQYFNIEVTDDVGDAILIGRYAANRLYDNWVEESF